MHAVRHKTQELDSAVASAFANVEQGVAPTQEGMPSMSTPTAVTVATTPEDVSAVAATVSAATSVAQLSVATQK